MSKPATMNAAQLVLFEMEDRRQSHLIALYDLAPRFIFAPRTDTDAASGKEAVKSVYREFSFRGQTFYLTLQPARMAYERDGDGKRRFVPAPTPEQARSIVEAEVFPSEREQIVEAVVRRLAMDPSRLSLDGENQDQVRLDFSLYDIRRELRAVNHSLNCSEIREALTILARTRLIISKAASPATGKRRGKQDILDSTAFPVLVIRRPDGAYDDDGEDDQTYVQFNPLVATAIRGLEFRPVSYEWLMKLKSPVSRWLYNRLSVEFDRPVEAGAEPEVVTFSADEIVKNSGMNEWSRRRDTLRIVTSAVDALVEEGILDSLDKVYDKTGKRIDGIHYVMRPSQRFLDQVRRAETVSEVNAAVIQSLTGETERPDRFVPLTPVQAVETRRTRARRLATVQQDLPLLGKTGTEG